MSSWTGRRGREEVLTLSLPGFSSSEKLESSIITESGEPCSDRQVKLQRNGERRATRLCVLMKPGYNDANGGSLLQVANKLYCSIDC